jgi:hypothetical protein
VIDEGFQGPRANAAAMSSEQALQAELPLAPYKTLRQLSLQQDCKDVGHGIQQLPGLPLNLSYPNYYNPPQDVGIREAMHELERVSKVRRCSQGCDDVNLALGCGNAIRWVSSEVLVS